MIAVNERCGILGGLFFLGSVVVDGVELRCAGFCAPRICGRNQVDQNKVYVNNTDIKFTDHEMTLLEKGPKYNLHYKKRNWIQNLALEAETAKKNNPTQDTTSLIHRNHTIHSSYLTC